ncbi:MAG TPA: cbb3-type cytochrome c oxidase subunit 3 [Gammaproteobacteria bacterium]|nr:cbb3-type cytochrome c oxidase subunit 3 [Gammaproteobacteria bacterium]
MLAWLGDLTNSKIAALLVFFPLFVAIVIYVYGSRKRSDRLESYKYIPLQDDDEQG